MRIFCLLLAVVLLLGASVLTASFAEEPAAGAHGDSKAAVSPTESGAGPSAGENAGAGTAKVDSRQREQGKGDDAKTPRVDGLGPGHQTDEAIDTRIGMPSRHVDGGRDKIGSAKARARLLQPWRRATPGRFDQGLRNAIGVPLARREGLERRRAERRGAPSVMPDPAAAGTTAAGHVDRPSVLRAATAPSASPTILNRGAINGTSAMPRGAGSHSIGGPTRAVAGISGTAIRPKH